MGARLPKQKPKKVTSFDVYTCMLPAPTVVKSINNKLFIHKHDGQYYLTHSATLDKMTNILYSSKSLSRCNQAATI
jgi:hypothetical protein